MNDLIHKAIPNSWGVWNIMNYRSTLTAFVTTKPHQKEMMALAGTFISAN
eukprot:gene13934-4087_t